MIHIPIQHESSFSVMTDPVDKIFSHVLVFKPRTKTSYVVSCISDLHSKLAIQPPSDLSEIESLIKKKTSSSSNFITCAPFSLRGSHTTQYKHIADYTKYTISNFSLEPVTLDTSVKHEFLILKTRSIEAYDFCKKIARNISLLPTTQPTTSIFQYNFYYFATNPILYFLDKKLHMLGNQSTVTSTTTEPIFKPTTEIPF